ncbi:hypothetical protein OQA88_11663 [Cercophora sp. LCS_1]
MAPKRGNPKPTSATKRSKVPKGTEDDEGDSNSPSQQPGPSTTPSDNTDGAGAPKPTPRSGKRPRSGTADLATPVAKRPVAGPVGGSSSNPPPGDSEVEDTPESPVPASKTPTPDEHESKFDPGDNIFGKKEDVDKAIQDTPMSDSPTGWDASVHMIALPWFYFQVSESNIRKHQDNTQCFALGQDMHYNYMSLDSVPGFDKTRSGNRDWDWGLYEHRKVEAQPIGADKDDGAAEHRWHSNQHVAGLTIGIATIGLSQDRATALLGFKTTLAMITWLDYQCPNFIGKVVAWNKMCPKANVSWQNILHRVANLQQDSPQMGTIIDFVRGCKKPVQFILRKGDVQGNLTFGTHHYDINATAIVALYNILRFSTIDDEVPRFKPSTDATALFGYSPDDWVKAVAAFVYFTIRRKGSSPIDSKKAGKGNKVLSNAKGKGKRGAAKGKGKGNVPAGANDADSADEKDADHDVKPNVYYFVINPLASGHLVRDPEVAKTSQAIQFMGSALGLAKASRGVAKNTGDCYQVLRNMEKRQLYLMGVQRGIHPSRSAIESAAKGKISERFVQVPAISEDIQDGILEVTSASVDCVRQTHATDDDIRALGPLTGNSNLHDLIDREKVLNDVIAAGRNADGTTEDPIIIETKVEERLKALESHAMMSSIQIGEDPDECDFDEALDLLGIDKAEVDWSKGIHPPGVTNKTFYLGLHQVSDAIKIQEAIASPFPCMLLGNEVGTGKTSTALASVWARYQSLCRQVEEGGTVDVGPTLILAPASLVSQIFHEAHDLWHPKFKLSVYYGTDRSAITDQALRDCVLPSSGLHKKMDEWASSRNEPKNVLNVVISSYSTLGFRCFKPVYKNVPYGSDPHTSTWNFDGPEEIADSGVQPGRVRMVGGIPKPGNEILKKVQKAKDAMAPPEDLALDDSDAEDEDEHMGNLFDDIARTQQREVELLKEAIPDRRASGRLVPVVHFRLKMTKGTAPIPAFDTVFCDESHGLRNPRAMHTRLVNAIPKRGLIMMTATPTLTKLEDIRGPAFLAERLLGLGIGMKVPDGTSWHWLSTIWQPFTGLGDDSAQEIPPLPYLAKGSKSDLGAVQPPTDPNLSQDNLKELLGAVFASFNDAERRREMIDYTVKTGKRWWCLSPWAVALVRSDGVELGRERKESDAVFRAIMHCLVRRRGSTTPVTAPDGKVYFPCAKQSTCRVSTETMRYSEPRRQEVIKLVEKLVQVVPVSAGNEPDNNSVPSRNRESTTATQRRAIDMAVVRLLMMASADFKSLRLAVAEDPVSASRSSELIRTLRGLLSHGEMRNLQKTVEIEFDGVEPQGARLGTTQVENLIRQDVDGGLSYYYVNTVEDPNCVFAPSADRAAMTAYAMSDAPILQRAVHHVVKNKKEGERTLVVCYSQYMQQLLVSILDKLCIQVLSVRSSNSQSERDQAYQQFNDPNSDVDVLVLNMAVNAAGLSLHRACCRGLVLQEGWSFNLTFQAISKLYRTGQRKDVLWYLLQVEGTYSEIHEDKNSRKHVAQLRLTMKSHPCMRNQLIGSMVAYEHLKASRGSPFNRFVWVLCPPQSLEDYSDEAMAVGGHFISHIARYLLSVEPASLGDEKYNAFLEELAGSIRNAVVWCMKEFIQNVNGVPDDISPDDFRDMWGVEFIREWADKAEEHGVRGHDQPF